MESIIEIKNLSFRYQTDQEHYDVHNISFHVKRGEWLSIVGHNGSGKSTTVRLVDGLLEAESGEIWIDGDCLTPENVWEKRRKIGMVFQNPDNQFVGATVEDDVAFGLENQGIPLEEMKKFSVLVVEQPFRRKIRLGLVLPPSRHLKKVWRLVKFIANVVFVFVITMKSQMCN